MPEALLPGCLAGRIQASATECGGHWQQRDYKSFSPGVDWDSVDWATAPAIQVGRG